MARGSRAASAASLLQEAIERRRGSGKWHGWRPISDQEMLDAARALKPSHAFRGATFLGPRTEEAVMRAVVFAQTGEYTSETASKHYCVALLTGERPEFALFVVLRQKPAGRQPARDHDVVGLIESSTSLDRIIARLEWALCEPRGRTCWAPPAQRQLLTRSDCEHEFASLPRQRA